MFIPVARRRMEIWFTWWVAGMLGGASLHAQREGEQQWRFSVGGSVTLSSPVLSPDGATLYVGVETLSGGRVVAISARDGGPRAGWGSQGRVLTDAVESSPAVSADGSTIYVGSADGTLYALRAADGRSQWELPLGTFISSSPAIGRDGTIYVGTGDGRMRAVSPNGTQRWSFATGNFIWSSPAIGADGTIYFGSYDRNFYALTPDGSEKWPRIATGSPIFSSPAIGADGTIYVGSGDQRLYAIAPDGTKIWDYLVNGPIDASPTLGADGTVYFAADRSFYALRPEPEAAERLRWKRDIATGSISTAVVRGDGAIIFGADDGIVRALNPDGSELWRFDTRTGQGNLIESSPIVGADGAIYVGSFDGAVYKLNGNGSPLSAYSSWPAFRRDTRHTAQAVASNSGGQLVNLSTRAQAGGGRNLIAGFVVQASQGRAYLIRAVGPGLQAQGVAGFMPDPVLELFSGQLQFHSNDNWRANDEASGFPIPEAAEAVQAFALAPGSLDAAILPGLLSGVYTARVGSADGRTGVALVEVYDVRNTGDPTARLLNLSTRGFVGTGETTLIAGFVVGGTGSMRLLLRGIGPGLTQFGVSGVLAQPRLTIFSGGTPIGTNTNWIADGYSNDLMVAAAAVSAFPLVQGRADAAMIFDAKPGPYTLQITGVGDTTGETMVEIYVLP
jgi:outer membrane protein assembly factor BamB